MARRRYGRNQKRKAREKIAELEKKLRYAEDEAARFDYLHDQLDNVARYCALLPPKKLKNLTIEPFRKLRLYKSLGYPKFKAFSRRDPPKDAEEEFEEYYGFNIETIIANAGNAVEVRINNGSDHFCTCLSREAMMYHGEQFEDLAKRTADSLVKYIVQYYQNGKLAR